MSPAEHFVLQINQLFGALIVAAIFILGLKKIVRNSSERLAAHRRQRLRPHVMMYLMEGSETQLQALMPRNQAERHALLHLFLTAAETIKGDVSRRLYRAFQELQLVDDVIRRLNHRRWWIRAEAAYQLGVINNPQTGLALTRALGDSNREVVLSASRALANAHGVDALEPILKHVETTSRWDTLEVADIFFTMGREVVPRLLQVLDRISLEAQRLVIEVLGHFKDGRAMLPLLPRLQSKDKEIRAKTLKTLGAIGNPAAAPPIVECLGDGDWQIRLLACGALGQLKERRSVSSIAERLFDEDVRVCQRAVEVLASFGETGQPYLNEAYRKGDERLRKMLAPYKAIAAAVFLFLTMGVGSSVHAVKTAPRPPALEEVRLTLEQAHGALRRYRQLTQQQQSLEQRLAALELMFSIVRQQAESRGESNSALAMIQHAEDFYRFRKARDATANELLGQLVEFTEVHLQTLMRDREADLLSADEQSYKVWLNSAWAYSDYLARGGGSLDQRLEFLYRLLTKALGYIARAQPAALIDTRSGYTRFLAWPRFRDYLPAPVRHFGREFLDTVYYRRPWKSIPYPLYRFLEFYNHSVLFYFVFLNATYLILFIISFFAILRYLELVHTPFTSHMLRSPMTLPISMLVPAYNESAGIVESVRSYLNVHFPEFEVIVINDGSKDNTLALLREHFQLVATTRANPQFLKTQTVRGLYSSPLHPHLLVVDKENGGKSDALNAGLNLARYPLICAVDADSVLEPQALLRVVRPFMTDADVVAVGGVVRIANGNRIRNGNLENVHLPRKVLPLFQIVEYLRAFFSGRMAWSAMDCLMLISGAFGLFRKEVVLACGGYRTDTVGEDMDLVVRMHRYLLNAKRRYRMVFIPDPICWTEAPESLSVLRHQRDRWQRGLLDVLWVNRVMCFNPKYGRIGLLAMPYYMLVELIGPIIEFGGYVAVLLTVVLLPQNMHFLRLFFMTAVLFGILLSIGAVILEELAFHRYPRVRQMLAMILMAALENLGYRQINAWWRCRGILRGLMMKEGWGTMVRRGVGTVAVLLGLAVGLSAVLSAAEGPTPGQLYEQGMQQRREGHFAEARKTFEQMQQWDPKSGGALEGLGLVALAEGRYVDAERYFAQWNLQTPDSPYILGLLARAYREQGKTDALITTYQALVRADPKDETAQARLDSLLRKWRSTLTPKAKIRKSVGPEGLSGPAPQRIVYEGHSGGVDARLRVKPGLYALAGAEAIHDAQRNDTRGFTYYDILEQIYTLGADFYPREELSVLATYGQSFMSDVKELGVGRIQFSRVRAEATWDDRNITARLRYTRTPRFLRGTGSDRFFAVLSQNTGEGLLELTQWTWDWRFLGGVDHYSEGTTAGYGSVQARKEFGYQLFVLQGQHSQQEFYGATPEGKLGLVDYNKASARLRRWVPERYRLDGSYGYSGYVDRNHLHEVNAEAAAWLPFYKALAATYRYQVLDYDHENDRYSSTDGHGHWVGGFWHRGWGGGLWTTFSYEHGYLFDISRRFYQNNTWRGEANWFVRDRLSFNLIGQVSRSTLRDLSHSIQLEGRYSF